MLLHKATIQLQREKNGGEGRRRQPAAREQFIDVGAAVTDSFEHAAGCVVVGAT